ncbi:MAG: hypothetical protein GX030_10755 [Firmicutes bacterium]|nr:hypothetical protein [Bacillota bacterium]
MIKSFSLEFNNKEELDKVVDKLWFEKQVTGEVEKLPLKDGKWRLNVHSEKALRQSTIDALAGKSVTGDFDEED